MLTPTQDQWMGQLRQLLPILGTVLAFFGFSPDAVATWTNLILQIAGPAMIIGSMVWSMIANSRGSIVKSATANLKDAPVAEKAQIVSAVAALPEVDGVKLDKSQPGAMALNAQTPATVSLTP